MSSPWSSPVCNPPSNGSGFQVVFSTAVWGRAPRGGSGRGAAPGAVFAHLPETWRCHALKTCVEPSK